MRPFPGHGSRGSARGLAGLLAVSLAALFVIPVGAIAAPMSGRTITVVPLASSSAFYANVSWDNTNISTAGSATSAFRISFGTSVNLYYAWRQPVGIGTGAVPWSINDARLQIFYFGFAIGTRDVTTATGSPSGSIVMSAWNTGALEYVIEGTYKLTASLIATNGTTAWSQSFWVDVAAAYYLAAALPIVLILLLIYELYSVATVGKQQALKRKKSGATNAPPPPEPPTPEPSSSSEPPTGGAS